MSTVETTTQSWTSRLSESIKGILVGFGLVIAAIVLLFWNEGRTVKRYKTLVQGEKECVSVKSDEILAENDGNLIYTTGELKTDDILTDNEFSAVSVNALKLIRKVEMYQWKEKINEKTEKKMGGGTTTTRTASYSKGWSSGVIDSSSFMEAGHDNPSTMPYEPVEIMAEVATLGEFDATELISMAKGEKTWKIEAETPTEAPVVATPATVTPATVAPVEAPATTTPAVVPATETPAAVAPATETPAAVVPATVAPATETPATVAPATVVPAEAPVNATVETTSESTATTEVAPAVAPAVAPVAVTTAVTETPAVAVPATQAPAVAVPATQVPAVAVPATQVPVATVPATVAPVVAIPDPSVPKVYKNSYYFGTNPDTPQVGDVRVSFTYVPNGPVSVIAGQLDGKLIGKQLDNGSLLLLESGTVSCEEMFSNAQKSNTIIAWVLRFAGFFLAMMGLNMIFKPLSVVADVIPFIGSLVGGVTGVVAFLLALMISLTTIGISWLYFRPMIGIPLLVVALLCFIYSFKFGKKKE